MLEQPTEFDLIVNLTTAKALGLVVPDKLIALADDVLGPTGLAVFHSEGHFEKLLRTQ